MNNIKYNTLEEPLAMREYGRHIQQLIKHCLTIEDREERTRVAYSIADIMAGTMADNSTENVDMRKIFNHMNIISGFKLDIDYPCEVLAEEEIKHKPAPIPYSVKSESFRVYGSNILKMIKEVSKMEAGVEKDQTIFLVANQMKKLLIGVNADSATDHRVFKDIKEISGGVIDIDAANYKLNEYIGIAQPETKKKKKK